MQPSKLESSRQALAAPEQAVSRRSFLRGAALAAGALAFPGTARFASAYELPGAATDAIGKSTLVYVSPLRSSGAESTCHGEVWFVADAGDLMVVTSVDRWKAEAIGRGLDRARLWVGDHGVWKRAGSEFKRSPSFVASASLDRDATRRARVLTSFGKKYPDEWDKWGPRFRKGLEDESRVLIRYAPTGP